MDFSPADLFRSTKTGSRSSLDRVNKQLSASRGTFRQKVHIGVLLATLALVAYGAIIIWSASQFKADASFSRHLLGIGIGAVLAVLVWRTDLRGISNFSTALLVIDLIVIFSPKIPGLSYTGGLGMTGWIKIPGIGLTFQPVELAKLITIFFIATLGSQYNGRIDTARDYIKLCGMLSVPFLAVVAMGDLGSGLVVLVSGAVVICMSGARREWVLSTLALLVGLVALILALDSVLDSLLGHDVLIKQYQMNRLTSLSTPIMPIRTMPTTCSNRSSRLDRVAFSVKVWAMRRSLPVAFCPSSTPTSSLPFCPRPLASAAPFCCCACTCCSCSRRFASPLSVSLCSYACHAWVSSACGHSRPSRTSACASA